MINILSRNKKKDNKMQIKEINKSSINKVQIMIIYFQSDNQLFNLEMIN